MKVKITDIPAEGISLEFALETSALYERFRLHEDKNQLAESEYSFPEPPLVHLRLHSENTSILVKGRTSARLTARCSRCLDDVFLNLNCVIDLVLEPVSKRIPQEEQLDDLGCAFYEGIDIDCAEIVMDYLLLELPYVAYCREDCKGLCPECGSNLNFERCECRRGAQGSDCWSVLSQVKAIQ